MQTEFLEEDEQIIITDNGKQITCDLLFTFESDDKNTIYVGYTDNVVDSNGRKNIYVGKFNKDSDTNYLEKIETEEEQKLVQEVLKQIDEDVK